MNAHARHSIDSVLTRAYFLLQCFHMLHHLQDNGYTGQINPQLLPQMDYPA